MEPENIEEPAGTSLPEPTAVVSPPPGAEVEPVSPWENYLTGKKQSPEKFLATLVKSAITLPDDAIKHRFVETLLAKPERMARFVLLLQASQATSNGTLRKITGDFAEAAIHRLQLITLPEPLDGIAFKRAISSWLASIRKRQLGPPQLNQLYLLLHFGALREVLDTATAFYLVSAAVSKSGKKVQRGEREEPLQSSLQVLLSASPTRPVLTSLAAHAKVTERQMAQLNAQIAGQAEEIASLRTEVVQLKANIAGLEEHIANLKRKNEASEEKIQLLEREIVEIRDGYQHKLDALRARIRGVLQGQLTRWIETALDAARAEPPFTQAVQERLEDSLKLIQKEIQWLQPSA